MARAVSLGASALGLREWEATSTPEGAAATPERLDGDLIWRPAIVPGNAVAVLSEDDATHTRDVWYRCRLPADAGCILVLHGLATISEVWVGESCVARGASMFQPLRVVLPHNAAWLHLCFRALAPALAQRRGRARWRPRLAAGGLRGVRTTLLGHMPGWCPEIPVIGPWRDVELVEEAAEIDLRCTLQDGVGVARIAVTLPRRARHVALRIGGRRQDLLVQDGQGLTVGGTLALPDIALWWPHTHGEPARHEAVLEYDGKALPLGRVGFRRIEVERGADGHGFSLRINGVDVFCRGACWTAVDLARLPQDRAAFLPFLSAARDAGMNMLRVGGTMFYEADAFYDLAAELGILLWQDFMFANFDYPSDANFLHLAAEEARAFLDRTQTCPALAVLCGASEIAQQAGMFGLPPEAATHELFDRVLPDMVAAQRPDVPYVPHSPGGEGVAFLTDRGIAHYYGVGAYLRPVSDTRRAGVRFAAECLAFANLPDAAGLGRLGTTLPHDPRWKAAVPRDPGAGWDFEDVRDHYLHALFGEEARDLRWRDLDRYLELSRVVPALVMQDVFAEWRRPGSGCGGGLVWQLQDLRAGAGWGVLEDQARPKPVWHALAQVLQKLQVLITDEGLNGLALHVLNETSADVRATLSLCCLRDGAVPVAQASRDLALAPHSAMTVPSFELLGRFFDITAAYRFGKPEHDVTIVTLTRQDADTPCSMAVHFPQGPALPSRELGISAQLAQDNEKWVLHLRAERFAQFVHVIDPHYRARPDWFHLPPGIIRQVTLFHDCDATTPPAGHIVALNGYTPRRYS